MEIRKWRPFEEELDLQLLSMEQHSVCNLRCTYCDETYYGGLRENYDVEGLLTSLAQAGSLDNLELAVWGGGEPVLDPQFAKYVDIVNQNAVNLTHRFLSNSLRYSEKIAELLESKTGLLVTSIDAGNEETYQTVRGRSGFAKVWSNLSRYSRTSPDRVTVKYIFTQENSTKSNVDGFVSQIKENDLKGAFFQISSDFKDEFLDQERINAILYLFASLLSINVEYVYLDDLIWQRWKIDSRRNIRDLSMPVSSTSSWQNALAVPENEEKIVFWGANQLTRLLLSEEEFRSRWNIVGVIDTNPNLWGSKVYGFEVKDPRHFAKSEIRIFLSGIQSIHMLYHSIPSYGFDKSQVLRKILW
jgi:organic radical activating enzyme